MKRITPSTIVIALSCFLYGSLLALQSTEIRRYLDDSGFHNVVAACDRTANAQTLQQRPPLFRRPPGKAAISRDYDRAWMLVSKKRNVMVTFIPKVMCTSVRQAISLIECGSYDQHCHEARYERMGEENGANNEMTNLENMTRVVLIRDPLERALSAYLNSPHNDMIQVPGCLGGTGNHTCSLWDWVNSVANQTKVAMLNEHIKSQKAIVQFERVHYHYVLRMSSAIDRNFLWNDLLGTKPLFNNTSTRSSHTMRYYDILQGAADNFEGFQPKFNQTLQLLAKVYHDDMKLWEEALLYGTPRQKGEMTLFDYYKQNLEQEKEPSSGSQTQSWRSNDNIGPVARSSLASSLLSRLLQFTSPKPDFFFLMHVPKTGGLTFTYRIRQFIDTQQGDACSRDFCCTPWEHYIRVLKTRTILSGNESSPCRSFTRQITLSGIHETQRELFGGYNGDNLKQGDVGRWWYTASLFQNPILRFVSAARHNLLAKRCDTRDVARAVYAKLRGGCNKAPHDQEQAYHFYNISLDRPSRQFNPDSSTKAKISNPLNHVSNFDFVGITSHMDASTCVLAMDLAARNYTTSVEAALKACIQPSTIQIRSSLEQPQPLELAPLTTTQVVTILRDRYPVDTEIYPRVLVSFQKKLAQLLFDYPEFEPMYRSDLHGLITEITVWSRVASWIRDYKNDNEKLFKLMDSIQAEFKEILAPGLGWESSD